MIRFPPRKILVPFDFTDASQAAWRQAVWLAERFNAALDVLYSEDLLPAGMLGFGASRLTPALRREIRAHLRHKLGRPARLHISQGDPAVVVLRLARTLRPDLIVMGTHGRTGMARLRNGSVAGRVARVSPVPILVVREKRGGPLRAIAALDAGRGPSSWLPYAQELAASCRARLELLPPERSRSGDALLKAAAAHDLLVVGAGRASLREMFTGTTAEKAVRLSPAPVLCVPEPALTFAGR